MPLSLGASDDGHGNLVPWNRSFRVLGDTDDDVPDPNGVCRSSSLYREARAVARIRS